MKKIVSVLVFVLLAESPLSAQPADNNERIQQLVYIIQSSEQLNFEDEMNELLSIYRQQYSEACPQFAEALMWAAMVCVECGDNKQGRTLLERSDRLFKQYGHGPFDGRDTIQQIFHLDLYSRQLNNSGASYRALKEAKRSLQLKETYFGTQSESYLNELLNLSSLYAGRLKYRKSNQYHNAGFNSYVELIKREFCSTSESERIRYWEKAIKYIDQTIRLAHKSGIKSQRGGEQSLAAAAYNAMLLSKGLLLNTTIGFENYIISSGNEEAIRNLQLKKQLADQQASQDILDSLDYVILHALQERGQGFQLPHLSCSWKDVSEHLTDKDLAIEFYRTTDNNYGAILLKHGWKSPRVVRLKNFVASEKGYLTLPDALNAISLETYTPDKSQLLWNLSKAVWRDDIVKHFPVKGDGRVFFAADGELLMTGIEYLPFVQPKENESIVSVADLYHLYRLSSTRELAIRSTMPIGRDAAVYGGLRYDMYTDDLLADAQKYQTPDNNILAYEPIQQQRAGRSAESAIPYLQGTEKEAESIVSTINSSDNQKLVAQPFEGEDGTEASLKSQSGRGLRVLHIATHGFFYGDDDTSFERFNLGNHPLVRSGLFFSGADNKWFGDSIPPFVDDGFLTSLEIANLDFRGLDLVVLSACETGRGNIQADGVFGLQRGFKMASANSILMSLWKVDDEATCLLMTEFYKNWMGGATKHDALEAAKQTVRSHTEKGWDDPKYWAAFILLDALD